MQVITTKYLGPTNSKGSRIKATCSSGSLTVGYDHSANHDARHRNAAEALVKKMGWEDHGIMIGGSDDKGNWTFVNANYKWDYSLRPEQLAALRAPVVDAHHLITDLVAFGAAGKCLTPEIIDKATSWLEANKA
ncbi:hypothetical protein Lumi_070 [Xylophilus phage Lumi]|nr:hypothetical protein Lumi_070 [Xylophilus phage Lumi]